MSQVGVILALIFSLIIAIFAIANNQPIVVNYLYGRAEMSAVIVILGAAILGALIMFMLNLFRQIKVGFQVRGLRHEIKELKDKLAGLEKERDALLLQVGQLQEASGALKSAEAEALEKKAPGEEQEYEGVVGETEVEKGTEKEEPQREGDAGIKSLEGDEENEVNKEYLGEESSPESQQK